MAYDWRIDTDALAWGANAADVLLIRDIAAISTGRSYAQILQADNAQARFDAVMQSDKRDDGRGVAYQIQYCIRPDPDVGNETLDRGYRPLVCRSGGTSRCARTASSASSTSATNTCAGSLIWPAATASPAN